MKKIFVFCLAVLIGFPLLSSVFANDTYQYIDTSTQILVPEVFENIFLASEIQQIGYDYSILTNDSSDRPDEADVTLEFGLYIDDLVYHGDAVGKVNGYAGVSFFLWEGVLSGAVNINGVAHDVLVGFAKEDSTDKVQLSINVKTASNQSNQHTVIFAGDNVITVQMDEMIQLDAPYDDIIGTINPTYVSGASDNDLLPNGFGGNLGNWEDDEPVNYGGYVLELYKSANFNSPISAKGIAESVYFNNNNNTIAICLHTYENNVRDYYNSIIPTHLTYVSCLEYSLKRDSDGNSYIAGIESFDFGNFNGGNTLIASLFEDILSVFGIPTSTISTLLSSVYGEVSFSNFTNQFEVVIDFPITHSKEFNTLTSGLPIVFQLGKRPGNDSSLYTAKVKVIYLTKSYTTNPSSGNSTVIYIYDDIEVESVFEVTAQ